MVRDHTAVNKQAVDLVKKLKVTPEDNDTSRARRPMSATISRSVAARSSTRLILPMRWNGALETTLIPSASNPELESLLQTGLKILQGHEQHAEKVAAALKNS